MLKAIIWKEFRELLPAIAVALALQLFFVYVYVVVPGQKYAIEQADLRFVASMLTVLGILFAAVMGVWQNKAEKSQGTFLLLLHRPVRREAIVGAKLIAGACLCLLVLVLPLACFSFWAETREIARYEGESSIWSISSPVCAGLVLIYFGAYMSGARESAWYKSQFLPLFAALGFLLGLGFLAHECTPLVLVAMPVIEACYVVAILYESMTRNYS